MKMKHWIAAALLASCMPMGQALAQDKPAQELVRGVQVKLQENDLDGAIQLLDEAVEDKVSVSPFLRQQVAMMLQQKNRSEDAMKQITIVLEEAYKELDEKGNPSVFASVYPMASSLMRRGNQTKQADEWLEKGLSAISSKLDAERLTPLHAAYGQMVLAKSRSLIEAGKADEGKAMFVEYVANAEKLLAKNEDDAAIGTMLSLWSQSLSNLSEDEAKAAFTKGEALAQGKLKDSIQFQVLQGYLGLATNYISMASRVSPDNASEALEGTREFLKSLEPEEAASKQSISQSLKNLDRISNTIESSRALLSMVGQKAPDLDAFQWVNTEPTTLDGLKGKVVLLDFWAVWCGPCIATFPHLKHLDQEYGPKGLKILGVTRQYNFAWNDDSQSAARSNEPVSLEDELSMLKKFMEKHELTHGTMLTPEKSDMQGQYHVTGIPHAVVVDKQGIVRLIKVGSGDKNASDIEAMIQKLLAE